MYIVLYIYFKTYDIYNIYIIYYQLPACLVQLPGQRGGLLDLPDGEQEEETAGQRQHQLHPPEVGHQCDPAVVRCLRQVCVPSVIIEIYSDCILRRC